MTDREPTETTNLDIYGPLDRDARTARSPAR